MLKMFTEPFVSSNPICAHIWIFMVFFPVLYFSLFVLSFRRLCTGLIHLFLPHFRVSFHWFFYRSAQCAAGAVGKKLPAAPRRSAPPQTSLPCSNLCLLCVYYGNCCIFLKVFCPSPWIKSKVIYSVVLRKLYLCRTLMNSRSWPWCWSENNYINKRINEIMKIDKEELKCIYMKKRWSK